MTTYDVVVGGLGGFGSAAAAHLARRGLRVLGLDPRPGAHAEGSSHGESRIVRRVYYESPAYVPLLNRAYELWAELSDRAGSPLLRLTGGLFMGAAGSDVLEGSIATARAHGLPHEVLEPGEVTRRFPAFHPPRGTLALLEPDAGVVAPEAAVAAQLRTATTAGAELRHDVVVTGWTAGADSVRVLTSSEEVSAGALVLAPGRWAPGLVGDLGVDLEVQERVQHWFAPDRPAELGADRLPVWLWERADGTSLYGVPSLTRDGAVKAAVHFSGPAGPAAADWSAADVAQAMAPLVPGLGTQHVRSARCWYTLTPDRHFVIGRHPAADRVLVAAGFSGHGFKFTPVIGEALADLVADGTTSHDLSLFDPLRPR